MKLYPPIEIQQRFEGETLIAKISFNRDLFEKLMELQRFWTKLYDFITRY
jgi:hypothetical protein